MEKKRYSRYFDPAVLSRLKNFPLSVREIVEGFVSGTHKSNRFGINVEFKDHREYNPGDELKRVDWRLFAKTDRFYIKRFDEETNLFANIVLDVSRSMDFKHAGTLTKLEYAKTVAGSLLYLSVLENDYAGLCLFSDRVVKTYDPGNRLITVNEILLDLEDVPARGPSEFRKNLIFLSEKISKRSLVVLISDFLGDITDITDGIKYLKSKKNDIILFVINDACELDFSFKANVKFVDLETKEELFLNAGALREAYRARIGAHYRALDEFVHRSGIDIHYFSTNRFFDEVLCHYLLKRSRYA